MSADSQLHKPVQYTDHEVAQDRLHKNAQHIVGIEQKIHHTDDESSPSRSIVVRRKNRTKEDGPLILLCEWVVEHQIGMLHSWHLDRYEAHSCYPGVSVNLLLLLSLTHLCFPKARSQTRKFFELSYIDSESGKYTSGWNDACLVFLWIVVFTGLRASFIDFLFVPLGQWGGIQKKKSLVRFAEQAWLLVYYMTLFPLGMASLPCYLEKVANKR